MRSMRWLGYLWALPMTLCGLLLAAVAVGSGGTITVRGGIVEAGGGALRCLLRGGGAMALGHVILARTEVCLTKSRKHERHHVRQFECWGPFLLPVYWGIGLWLRWRGLDPYSDHPCEPPPERE